MMTDADLKSHVFAALLDAAAQGDHEAAARCAAALADPAKLQELADHLGGDGTLTEADDPDDPDDPAAPLADDEGGEAQDRFRATPEMFVFPGAGRGERAVTEADDGLYHGPEPPGPGWASAGVGPHGGKTWRKQEGGGASPPGGDASDASAAGGGRGGGVATLAPQAAEKPPPFQSADQPRVTPQRPPGELLAQSRAVAALPAEDVAALRYYSARNYKKVNGPLVDGRKHTPEAGAVADRMHRLLASATARLEEPVTAYRGLAPGDTAKARSVYDRLMAQLSEAAKKGGEVTLNGFQSTSVDPGVASQFSGNNIVLEIVTRRGLYLAPLSAHKHEQELLLPHGARYRVHAITEADYPAYAASQTRARRKVIQLELLDE